MERYIIPEGTRDYTIEECIKRDYVGATLINLFKQWSYKKVVTSTIEYYDTFCTKEMEIGKEYLYKFLDKNGDILVLRPDMTIPVARMVNTKLRELELPLKLCYLSNVFRVNESMKGLKNEYIDCGVELIGLEDVRGDLEVLVLAIESLKAVTNSNFKIEIGNIQILRSIFKSINLSEDQIEVVAKLIDKKNVTSLKEYVETLNIDKKSKECLNKLPWLFGGSDILKTAKELISSEEVIEKVEYLENLYNSLFRLGYEKYISFDLSMLPKLNYYTGIIFKGHIEGIGSCVLTGGRYDNLLKGYGRDLKALGFSINVDLLSEIISDNFSNLEEKVIIYEEDNVEAITKAVSEMKKGNTIEFKY